jgi:hypothetical protein
MNRIYNFLPNRVPTYHELSMENVSGKARPHPRGEGEKRVRAVREDVRKPLAPKLRIFSHGRSNKGHL